MPDVAPYVLTRGSVPLLISQPHTAALLPADLAARMSAAGQAVADTDWFVAELYQPVAGALGASVITPAFCRYAIDLNRPPDGAPLYPGARETGLCPIESFADEPLYRPGEAPDAREIAERRARWWQPYHDALAAELERLRAAHGYALLFDAHSIASRVPRFFDGRLPDFNFGSDADRTFPQPLIQQLVRLVEDDGRFSAVANGRFKGGYITRHYAHPARRIHSLQLELSQAVYMDESQPGHAWDPARAGRVQPLLQHLLESALDGCARLPAGTL